MKFASALEPGALDFYRNSFTAVNSVR